MFCPKCGSENKDGAKFCKKCGINLNNNSEVASRVAEENKVSSVKYLVVICIVLIAGLGITVGYIFHGQEATSDSSGSYQPSTNQSSSNQQSNSQQSNDQQSSSSSNYNSSASSSSSEKLYPCSSCQYPGVCVACEGKGILFGDTLCSFCNGTGKCSQCDGTGYHPLQT